MRSNGFALIGGAIVTYDGGDFGLRVPGVDVGRGVPTEASAAVLESQQRMVGTTALTLFDPDPCRREGSISLAAVQPGDIHHHSDCR
ncbi:hypothetical protein [Rhodococcus koreensis]